MSIFNGIVLLSYSIIHAKTLRSALLKTLSRTFKNSPDLNTETIRLKVLVFLQHHTNHDLKMSTRRGSTVACLSSNVSRLQFLYIKFKSLAFLGGGILQQC